MPLFTLGDLVLASGRRSYRKVEADALTAADWATLAAVAGPALSFKHVVGVARGGLPFADALRPYARPDAVGVLVADDVLTTGGSMERIRQELIDGAGWQPHSVQGVVAFARCPVPPWVRAVFTLSPWLADQECRPCPQAS